MYIQKSQQQYIKQQGTFKFFLKVKDLNPSHTLIMGDFNLGEINWRINNSHTNESDIASQFLECIRDCFLYQHVKENTRYGAGSEPSLLDLLLTNEENMKNSVICQDLVKAITCNLWLHLIAILKHHRQYLQN